jgi:predicted dehydrogenase
MSILEHEPLRVGLIGCGNVALRDHVPAYLSMPDRFRLVALADPTAARLELGRQLTGLDPADCHVESTALLARPDLDLIDVCTPQHLHKEQVTAALSGGRHVLSEKPLATTPRDAWAMVEAARAADRTLAIMHNYLFFTEVVRTLELIAAGEIGQVEVAILNWLGVLDNPGNAAYRPSWRHDSRLAGGGVLMDMLHIVYVAEALLGARIERVSSWVTARTDDAPVEDITLTRFETATNAALVNVGWGVGMGGFAVSGPLGRIEASYQDGGTAPFAPIERLVVRGRSGRGEEAGMQYEDGVRPLIADLADAIRSGRPPIADGAQGAHILEATLAVYASAATGSTWSLPLVPDEPVYERGVAGLAELELSPTSPIRTKRIFGLG